MNTNATQPKLSPSQKTILLMKEIGELVRQGYGVQGIKKETGYTESRVRWIIKKIYKSCRLIGNRSLVIRRPDLAKQWDSRNMVPVSEVACQSNKQYWWRCHQNHIWLARPADRFRGRGCPYCVNKKVLPEDSIAKTHPELVKEWDFSKNIDSPSFISRGCGKKFWWKCMVGHEWLAQVSSRAVGGHSCPYCFGKYLTAERSLLVVRPDLAKEWSDKNDKQPSEVFAMSQSKVVWKCQYGHEWTAPIAKRVKRSSKCPYCSGRKLSPDNNLAVRFPSLVKEWDYSKNSVDPESVRYGSRTRFWWICKIGHRWMANPYERAITGTSCPKCLPRYSRIELRIFCELKTIFRDANALCRVGKLECDIVIPSLSLVVEIDGFYWHKDKYQCDTRKTELLKNAGYLVIRLRDEGLKLISDNDITVVRKMKDVEVMTALMSKIKSLCSLSSFYRQAIDNYVKKQVLTGESEFRELYNSRVSSGSVSLATAKPELVADWDFEHNGMLTPENVSYASNKRVFWRCRKKHTWEDTVNHRYAGRGCPFCAGKRVAQDTCLAFIHPHVSKLWHPDKNKGLTPRDVSHGSKKTVWWFSILCGHEWIATVDSMRRGTRCRVCGVSIIKRDKNASNFKQS